MRRRPALVAVVAAGALAAALAGCSVEVVDDDAPTSPRPTAPRDPDRTQEAPADAGAGATGDAPPRGTAADDAAADDPAADDPASALPGRAELRALTTGQVTCAGGDRAVTRAGAAVEVTDGCGTLTVDGAAAVVVAGDVEHLVVSGAGAQVAVRSAGTVSLEGSAVTVTWEQGTPAVTGDTPGSTYGAVPAG